MPFSRCVLTTIVELDYEVERPLTKVYSLALASGGVRLRYLVPIDALIEEIKIPPVLALPKQGLDYSVDTDENYYQVGATLFQTDPNRERKPLLY